MQYFLIIASLFIFSACNPNKEKSPITPKNPVSYDYDAQELDAETHLMQYVDSFVDRMILAQKDTSSNLTRLNRTSIKFGTNFDPYVIGTCTIYGSGTRIIQINPDFWYGHGTWEGSPAHASSKEQLMYHELGHCVLNRDHLNTTTSGIADSIMNSYHLNFSLYLSYYTDYLAELFWLTANPPAAYVTDLNTNGFNQGPYQYSSTILDSTASMFASGASHGECQFHKEAE